MKWSFAAGTNLLKNLRSDEDSKLTLNHFAAELRSFRVVDISGMFLMSCGLAVIFCRMKVSISHFGHIGVIYWFISFILILISSCVPGF